MTNVRRKTKKYLSEIDLPSLSLEDNWALEQKITRDEIAEAIKSLTAQTA